MFRRNSPPFSLTLLDDELAKGLVERWDAIYYIQPLQLQPGSNNHNSRVVNNVNV